jgi:hypothetical protein
MAFFPAAIRVPSIRFALVWKFRKKISVALRTQWREPAKNIAYAWLFLSQRLEKFARHASKDSLADGTAIASSNGDVLNVLRKTALDEALALNRVTQLCGRSAPSWRHTSDTPARRACHPSTEPASRDRLNAPTLVD